MRKKGKVVAVLLATGLTLTTIFPQTAYAAEVGSQIKEANASVSSVLEENRDLLETAVKEAVLARDGDVSDQILMDQARSEIVAKIQSGEMTLKADTVKEDGLKETDSNPVEVVDYTSADEMISDEKVSEEKTATRLIVTSDAEPTDFFDAVSIDHYDDIWVLTYETAEKTEIAYNAFVSSGYTVEKDFSVDAIKEDEIPDEEVIPEITDTEVDDTTEDTVTEERKTIIAVIDTGISDVTNDDVFKDRIIEGTSVISDSYVDDNGHGTTMAKIIAEDISDENIYILPIKALDENGRGTVLSVALAIKYAKEHGADVINLSLSGVGQSNVLTNAINDCYNNGITVVTAAGNDNADAKDYIPGNVDTAINVAAADEDTDGKIISASYTNHGDNVDFAAIGTYQLSIEKEEVSLETELRGTSIASAHVAAYVALLKQINTQVSETDIMESLKASTVDLGEEGFDPYFGNGFLTKENLVFLKSDVEDQDKDTGADETEDDRNQKIEVATKKTIFIDQNHWWGFNDDNNWSAGGFDNAHPNGSPAQGLNAALTWFRGAGYDELEVCMMGDVQTYDDVSVPVNMKLTIYGSSIFSNGQKTWTRVGEGGSTSAIGGLTYYPSDGTWGLRYGETTAIELHTMNIIDNTTSVHYFGEAVGAVGSPIVNADTCYFFSRSHWWSVGASNGTFTNCTFDNTWGNGNRGAIASWRYLTVKNCTFNGAGSVSLSRAITYAGLCGQADWGTMDCRGSMYVDGCTINNYGGWNTAIGCSGNVTIKNTTVNVNKNTSSEDVGIIYGGGQDNQTCTIDNVTVQNAGMEGIRCDTNDSQNGRSVVSISSSEVYNCNTGIKVNQGTVNISGSNIYANKYGIDNKGTLNFCSDYDYNTYLSKNSDVNAYVKRGEWDSNAVYNHWLSYGMKEGRTASTKYSTSIHDNSSYGIYNTGSGKVNLKGSKIYSNGTGIYTDGGTVTLNFLDDNIDNEPRIYSNRTHGIENHATVNHYGGYIYSNGNDSTGDGIQNYGTYNMSGGNSDHNKHQGVWNHGKATFNYSGGNIYENDSNGLVNQGTLNITSNGDIRTNGSAGIYNICGTTNVSNVNIYDNGSYGIFNNANWNNDTTDGLATVNFNSGNIYQNPHGIDSYGADARTYIKGGTIGTDDDKKNTIGVYVNGGTTEMSNGTVKNSTEDGVVIQDGTMTFSKGTISGNGKYGVYIQNNGSATLNQSADIGTNYNGAVRNRYQGSGHYNLKKGAKCADGSDGKGSGVFLDTKASISITDALKSDIKVASYDRNTGKVVANCSNETVAKSAQDHLVLTENASFQKTTSNAKQTDDYGKTVIYRQGNGTNGKKSQVIVSQEETTTFDLNLASTGLKNGYISATIKTPDGDKDTVTTTTYWGEYTLPSAQAVAYYDGDVATHFVDALGWAESASGDPKYDETLTTYAAWGDKTLYAKWKVTFFYLKSDVNSPTDATATGGWGSVQSHSGNNAYAKENTASCDGYSFLGWFTKKDGGEMIYDKDGNIIKSTSLTSKNGRHYYDGDNGKTITLYAHWATIDISNITAKIGSQLVPLGNGDKTVVATYAGQNVYTDSKNSPYASNLYVKTLTRALNGDTAPNIDKIWVKVTNTSDPNQSKEYVLYDNAKGTTNYANNSLLDTIGDLPGAMDLTYEIHIKNTYGLEKVAETYTSRKIELYTTIEKVDTDINGEGDNTFSAGTRGILHVYTTGWVDNFNFTFPNDLNASWEFDKSLGYPVLAPSANDVFGFTTNDPNMTKYANKAYPSTVQNVPTLTGYKTYGDTGFIRCYDFYFWIPLTIDNPNNPNAEVVNDDTIWKIKTTARKFYNSKPTYKNGILTGQTTNNVVTSVSSVAAVGGDPKSVTKQFRTVIKKTG